MPRNLLVVCVIPRLFASHSGSFAVILSEAKSPAISAQDKLREESLYFAQGKLREESRSEAAQLPGLPSFAIPQETNRRPNIRILRCSGPVIPSRFAPVRVALSPSLVVLSGAKDLGISLRVNFAKGLTVNYARNLALKIRQRVRNEAGMCLGIKDLKNCAPIADWVGMLDFVNVAAIFEPLSPGRGRSR